MYKLFNLRSGLVSWNGATALSISTFGIPTLCRWT
jgi:hypothetical protein